jgi:hypothetical protein
MPLINKIKAHLHEIALALILLFLFYRNYTPHTWLIGWDNLMPELNLGMNIKRSFFAVWQEYQGLGLVGGMGHAADLIRQIILIPFVALLPNNLVRYFWHFFTIALGTYGIYFGIKNHFKFSRHIAFISALFYLLNFGSVQNYWAPFEPFSAFWGFFPWLIFSLWEVLEDPSRKNYIRFLVWNLFAIPSFYVQTIFIVYLICIVSVITSFLMYHRWHQDIKKQLQHSVKLLLIIFCLNAFWILPFAYFLKNDIQNPQLGFGNLIASEETFLRNQYRGGFFDFLLLRGYYYDFPDNGSYLMAAWQNHFNNPLVLTTGFLLSFIVLLGLFKTVLTKPKKISFESAGLVVIFIICAIALLSATPPFSILNFLIRQISVLNQVFRSPFTKFIVPSIFTFTLFFAIGLELIFQSVKRIKLNFLQYIFSVLLFVSVIFFSIPSFKGDYIYPEMRQPIPNDYFRLFDYFKDKPKTERIANLPSGNFWGWTNYRSDIRGSGFIWYGIEQPILDRAFDVWNLKNEQYYWELNYAIQRQDPILLQNLLDKYSVSYILFDNNIYFPDEKLYGKIATPTREMLNGMTGLKLAAQFGQIYIYKNHTNTSPIVVENPQKLSQSSFYYMDQGFQENSHYISSPNPEIIYPFTNLFTSRLPHEFAFEVKADNQEIAIKKYLNSATNYSVLNSSSDSFLELAPKSITVHIPITNRFEFNPSSKDLLDMNNSNSQEIKTESSSNFVRLTSSNQNNFFVKYFPELTFNQAYLVKIDYRHISNYPLTVSAFSVDSDNVFLNTKLESDKNWQTAWFVIPPYKTDDFETGLTIMFNNTSFNGSTSINDIKDIVVYPLPYNNLISTKLVSDTNVSNYKPLITNLSNDNSSIYIYKTVLKSSAPSNSFLALPQSFHQGWHALAFIDSKPQFLKNHVLVDNWENAWEISDLPASTTIYLFFWPQLLEFIGFGFFALITIGIFRMKTKG